LYAEGVCNHDVGFTFNMGDDNWVGGA
jgi:hypothetical protein